MAIELPKTVKKSTSSSDSKGLIEFLNKDISFSTTLSTRKKERFYSELHILLSSGIDIKTALDIIVEEQENKKDRILFKAVADDVLYGKSLSGALKNAGKFSPYEYFSIEIGEESGRIVAVLKELTDFYAKRIVLKRKMVNAFSYPVLVLCIALAAVIFLMTFLVPMFVDVFNRFNAELPTLTKTIISISMFFEKYLVFMFLVILSMLIGILSVRKKTEFQRIMSSILIKLPFFGNIIKISILERFFGTMALLIASRTPVLKAIQLTRQMISFYSFKEDLNRVEHDILHGILLHKSLSSSQFFDKRTISLIKVAEEVNQLDTIFEKLNKQLSEELDYKMGILSSMLEPILIIFVGVLVAVILIAMYLPMFQLSSTIY